MGQIVRFYQCMIIVAPLVRQIQDSDNEDEAIVAPVVQQLKEWQQKLHELFQKED